MSNKVLEYVRDDAGRIAYSSIEIPYKPEYIIFYEPNGEIRRANTLSLLQSNRFVLREDVAKAHGINHEDVSEIRLPTLSYCSADHLMMKVVFRIRK